MYRAFQTLLFLVLSVLSLVPSGAIATTQMIHLEGHLSEEALTQAAEELDQGQGEKLSTIVLSLKSNSGELKGVLDFAKKLYSKLKEENAELLVYINDEAVGAAALLPLMADQIYTTPVVSWGALTMGGEQTFPINILRSRVRSLIRGESSTQEIRRLLGEGMIDSSLAIVVREGEWQVLKEGEHEGTVVSPAGETLVLTHQEIKSLGLLDGTLSPQAFALQYQDEEKKHSKTVAGEEGTPLPIGKFTLKERLQKHIPFDDNGSYEIGHIYIGGHNQGIDQSTWIYVRKALEHYQQTKPLFILLELDTPGGEVFSSQQISDALKDMDTQYGIPVVALIDNWAISAGAMLAYSCRFIAVVKDASMGAAEPVFQKDGAIEKAPEKINSALRADFANRARFFDREPLLAEAMVDQDIGLLLRHNKVVKYEKAEEVIKGGLNPDEVITPPGKLLTLNTEQMLNLEVADLLAPPVRLEQITATEQEAGRWPAERNLLFHTQFFQDIPNATIDVYRMDWRTAFFAFLAKPAIASMLFMGLMLGFYMEMNTPGFGVGGAVGVACLSLILLSSFSTYAANWLELIILLAGLGLLGIELFIIPGFGLIGLVGIFLIIGGLFAMMIPALGKVSFDWDTQTFNAAGDFLLERLAWLSGTLIIGLIIIVILWRYMMPHFTLLNRLVATGEQDRAEGFVAGPAGVGAPEIGATGETISPLRPSGKAMLGGRICDVVSTGEFVPKGTVVKLVEIEGMRLIVERSKEEA